MAAQGKGQLRVAVVLEEATTHGPAADPFVVPIETSGARMHVGLLDGGRMHLSDGPIDLILYAEGDPDQVRHAYGRAARRFARVLDELVAELSLLRCPVDRSVRANGPIARRMLRAVEKHAGVYLTPMIAVAGSVADEILCEMTTASLRRAYVNNGGDIALHLTTGTHFRIGIADSPLCREMPARVEIDAAAEVAGIATSGVAGRSFSLGIADAVTVLGRDAATADTAATLIANAVDVEHPAIQRTPAIDLDPDSDLGERLVTTSRGPLPEEAVDEALSHGVATASAMLEAGAIAGALLTCNSRYRAVGSAAQLTS